jgi:DNA (cytosine-5)-methyltransferase 1
MRQSPTLQGRREKGIPGWVTAVEGIPRTAQLRLVGNGVVPQQGAAALQMLIAIAARYPSAPGPGQAGGTPGQRAAA